MASLSKQLSSLRDDRSKNLKRFISHYKSNIKWNNIEVSKAWEYFLSIDNQFDQCESIFSEIIYGSSFLSLDKPNEEQEDSELKSLILDKPKDIDFLTSDELDDLNTKIRTFVDLSVPYFMSSECEHLVDYLIYKYNIAVTFSEYLIVAYIQYSYSEYYCKLLSLFNIRNESTFHSFYNELKSVSMNFTEHKYIKSNVVFSGIAKNFTLYKQVSSCYDRLARVCRAKTNIVSFLNAVNFHYVLVNSKVMDNNEIRYVVNMVKEALSVDEVGEYTSSYLCLLISTFTHIQFTVAVQRELIASLKTNLSILRSLEVLRVDHLVVFKNIVMSIHLMLQYQKQTLEKLPHDITNSIIDILQKHKSVNIVFNNLKKIKGFDFSRTINVILNSLVSATLGKSDIQRDFGVVGHSYKIPGIDRIAFLLQFVNESFDATCMKMIVFNLIDEVNRISCHFRSHGDSIIEFDETRMAVSINSGHKFGSTLLLLHQLFKLVKKVNPTVLEYTIMEYLNRLSYERLQDQIEVIMYIFSSLSDDIVFRMLILFNKHSETTTDNNGYDKKDLNGIVGMKMMVNMFGLLNDKRSNIYKDERLFSSLVEFIVSMYRKTDSHTEELNRLLFNFINNSMNDEELSKKLESDDRFWKSVPLKISTESLECHIQSLIDSVDMSFKYDKENKVNLESFDLSVLHTKDYKFIFAPYVNHISNSRTIQRIFKLCNLILKNNKECFDANDEINISKSLRGFIRFILVLIGNKAFDFDTDHNYLLKHKQGISNDHLFDEKELVELNNDFINVLINEELRLNNVTDVEDEDENEYSHDNYGYMATSNRMIFSIFSAMYYQYETLDIISKSDENVELLHSQFVAIRDLVIKYLRNKVDKQHVKEFVMDFYKFMMCKYEAMLMMKSNQFNQILVFKSMETILRNNKLISFLLKCVSELFSSQNGKISVNINAHSQIINNIIEVLKISNTTAVNGSFAITYYSDNYDCLRFDVDVPFNYKHKHLNVDFVNLVKDSQIKHLISENSKTIKSFDIIYSNDIKNGLMSRKANRSISLFDNINDDFVYTSIETVLIVFKMNKNKEFACQMLMDILINTLEFIFDTSFKYSTKMIKMLIELAKLCQNTKVKYRELEMPLAYDEHCKYKSLFKYKVDIKYDMKMLFNNVLVKTNYKVETIDCFIKVISEHLSKDSDFFNLFISKVFITSKVLYNIDCYGKICSMIADCEHEVDVLFSLLEGITDDFYKMLNDYNKDDEVTVISFQEVFTRYSLLLYGLSKMNKLNSDNNAVKYVEQITHMLNIITMFKSITKQLNTKYDRLIEDNNDMSEMSLMVSNSLIVFEKVSFVLIYSLNKQSIWSLPVNCRNRFYYSFALYYNDLKPNYLTTLIKSTFDINVVDDKVVLCFVYNILSNFYGEDVIVYIINSIKSLKTYDVLIYMIKKNTNLDISVKINFMCKIVNNVLVSTDMENKKVQSFLFRHLKDLINVYLKVISQVVNDNNDIKIDNVNNFNDFYGNFVDTKLEKELKSLKMYSEDHKDHDDKKFKMPQMINELLNNVNNTNKNRINQLDTESVLSLLSVIVNQLNGMIDNIFRMDLENLKSIKKMYNELYHSICTLINATMSMYSESYKLLKKLINNLIVCTIKMPVESSIKSSDQSVTTTVIVTINNILRFDTSGINGELVDTLIDENKSAFADYNISVTWVSYLIYLYFICNKNKVENVSINNGDVSLNNDEIEDSLYSRYSKISSILNDSDKWINILYNVMWIHQVMEFDPVNNQGLGINKFKGYESCNMVATNNKATVNIDYDLAKEIYGFVSSYIQNNSKFKISFDVAFFNDRNSENRMMFIELNELIYSLLSSMVLYKKQVDVKGNKHLKSNDLKNLETNSDLVSLVNVITGSIMHIFNLNQLGGFNIHIYGTLNAMFENRLDEVLKSNEEYENVWDSIITNELNYNYNLHIVTTLMSIQNKLNKSVKPKDNTIKIKYERELDKLHNFSSRTLFDLFKHSEKMYLKHENENLFNQISQMKAEVWEYFVHIPPKSVDSFVEILENSFDLIKNHHKINGKLLWSYLDMIYSLKVMIRICVSSDEQKSTSNYDGKTNPKMNKQVGVNDAKQIGGIETTKLIGAIDISDSGSRTKDNQFGDLYGNTMNFGINYKIETNKMISTIKKFMEVSEHLLLPNILVGEFVNKVFLLFLVIAHKYCQSLLNKEFYEFSLKLVLNHNVCQSTSKNRLIDNDDDHDIIKNAFKEYLGLNIGDSINAITESSTMSFKYFKRELLISNVLYHTATNIDIKVLIRSMHSFYTLETESVQSIVNKLTIMLLSLSYNIQNKKPKSKYIDDLNDIYFIVINFYSKYSYKLLFGESGTDSFNEYNRSHLSIEDIVESSRKMSTSFFISKTAIESIAHFERSFIAFILRYFGLISSYKLLDVLEKQSNMSTYKDEFKSMNKINAFIEADLKSRILFIVILSSLHEYGNLGATNLIMTRLYQHIEDITDYIMSEARLNRSSADKELSFDNTWTWFNNCRFILELIQKSIDTWNAQRGVVPDVMVNSWVKIIKNFIGLFELLPINAEIEVDNLTTAFSKTLENTLRSLVNGFITQDDKIVKVESCLSDQLATKSLNVKIGSLVIMNNLWDDLGMHLSLTIKNVMPIIGELVDDENDIVRRLAMKLDEKVKEVLYQS